MSNLQTYHHFKLDFQSVDQHTGEKCLIHGTRRRKDNQLQSLGAIFSGNDLAPTEYRQRHPVANDNDR